jgi:hypothetical protein
MSGQYGYEWPVLSEADVEKALLGAAGDMDRGLAPKTEEMLIILAAMHAAGEPIRLPPRARRGHRRGSR